MEYKFSKKISLQVELLFSQQGNKIEREKYQWIGSNDYIFNSDESGTETEQVCTKLSYLNLPILYY